MVGLGLVSELSEAERLGLLSRVFRACSGCSGFRLLFGFLGACRRQKSRPRASPAAHPQSSKSGAPRGKCPQGAFDGPRQKSKRVRHPGNARPPENPGDGGTDAPSARAEVFPPRVKAPSTGREIDVKRLESGHGPGEFRFSRVKSGAKCQGTRRGPTVAFVFSSVCLSARPAPGTPSNAFKRPEGADARPQVLTSGPRQSKRQPGNPGNPETRNPNPTFDSPRGPRTEPPNPNPTPEPQTTNHTQESPARCPSRFFWSTTTSTSS